jgi:hypothetical protein
VPVVTISWIMNGRAIERAESIHDFWQDWIDEMLNSMKAKVEGNSADTGSI